MKQAVSSLDQIPMDLNLDRFSIDKISQTKSEALEENESKGNLKDETIYHDILYNSLLEWLLHKEPAHLEDTVMIDDTDKIQSVNAVLIMAKFYKHATEFIQQKVTI